MKIAIKIAAVAALVACAAQVYAGYRVVVQAAVNPSMASAFGTMSGARGSSDARQEVMCFSNNSRYAACTITDADGNSGSCTTSDPANVDLIRSIGPESFIILYWRYDGTCRDFYVQNSSAYKPGAVSGY